MKVIEFGSNSSRGGGDSRGNRDGICKYSNLAAKTTVKTAMTEGLDKTALSFFLFINAWHSAATPFLGWSTIIKVLK